MRRVAQGETVEGLSLGTIQKIQKKIQEVEQLSGRSFNEVVKPGVSNYGEVQPGKIHETLDQHERELRNRQEELKQEIRSEHQPNFGEMTKVAIQGAVVGAGFQVAFKLFEKYSRRHIG